MTDVRISEDSDLVCPTCHRKFSSAHALGGHLSAAHKPLVACTICSKEVREGVGMTQHMKLVHGVQKEQQQADRHRNPRFRSSQHTKGICPECNKVLGSKDIARHLRTVHGIQGGIRRYRQQQSVVGALVEKAAAVPAKRSAVPTKPEREPLTAEQIVRTACAWYWPEGVPLGQMEAVLRWHTQTTEFLEQATMNGAT